jgi:hypothetical protein
MATKAVMAGSAEYLPLPKAAAHFGLSTDVLRDLVAGRRVRAYRPGPRGHRIWIKVSELRDVIEASADGAG